MKKILACMIIIFCASLSYAENCWTPNCYGAVGFDKKTGQTHSGVDFPAGGRATNYVKKECPGCHVFEFYNTCGILTYSKSHNFIRETYGQDYNSLKSYAMNDCYNQIEAIGFGKTRGDRRVSTRRTNEKGSCQIVVGACTTRQY